MIESALPMQVRVQKESAVPYAIRLARETDVAHLAEIEKGAFPTTLPPTPFKRELSNEKASVLVAYKLPEEDHLLSSASHKPYIASRTTEENGLKGVWKRLLHRRTSALLPAGSADHIAGYVAIWFMTDEAHITGIAVREWLRGNGLGELLLMASIEMAMRNQSRVVTLEVRVSNHVAQSLYSKYGFSQVGIRKGYYTDNHEDAYIMTTDVISSPAYNQQLLSLKENYKTRRGNVALGC
ncbi:MAG: ribosomal protein S18-alanine N-acetyltransferase [Dehalococcoidia bacterium]|nr:ribosomal protein S18-alanine N-acetyltransferase [Dehalococcoidia bacterium]